MRAVLVGGGEAELERLRACGYEPASDAELLEAHTSGGGLVTLAARHGTRGLVLLTAGDDRLVGVQHDPPPGEALADVVFDGCLALDAEALEYLPDGGGLADLLGALLDHGEDVRVRLR